MEGRIAVTLQAAYIYFPHPVEVFKTMTCDFRLNPIREDSLTTKQLAGVGLGQLQLELRSAVVAAPLPELPVR